MTEPGTVKPAVETPEAQTHDTRMVVWATPAPAVACRPTSVHVGVQCTAGCSLAGQAVEIRDSSGGSIGRAVLGDVPLDGTSDLYWATVSFDAPMQTGVASRTAVFVPSDGPEIAHLESSALFTFHTDPPPQHSVIITIVRQETGAPVDNAEVQLGRYSRTTNKAGEACFDVPAGSYTCTVRKWGIEVEPVEVEVSCNLTIQVEAVAGLTRDEYDEWVSKYEDHPWG